MTSPYSLPVTVASVAVHLTQVAALLFFVYELQSRPAVER